MTNVTFYMDSQGIWGFLAEGHSGYKQAGEDIVCAAISALTQTTVIGLQQVAHIEPQLEVDEQKGYLLCRLPKQLAAEEFNTSQVILKTLHKGLLAILEEYESFMRVREVQP